MCEEVFFRSVIQGGLARHIGTIPGLAVASVIFGIFHLVNKTYALIATLIGAYLGILWIVIGNLLAPIATHAVYDFVALAYFLRAHVRPREDDANQGVICASTLSNTESLSPKRKTPSAGSPARAFAMRKKSHNSFGRSA